MTSPQSPPNRRRRRIVVAVAVLVLALGGSPVLAQVPDDSPLLKELTELVATRSKAVSTVHILADRLSPPSESMLPLTFDQVREAVVRYGASATTESDREALYRLLSRPLNPTTSRARKIEFYRDGPRTAEYSGYLNFVNDERASIQFSRNQDVGIHAYIRYPQGFKSALTLGSFSRELTIKVPEATFVRVRRAIIDDTDHIVLTWQDQETEVVCEIAREDGIIRAVRSTSKGFESLTIQSGRIRTRDGMPFPAVSGQFTFNEGKLSSVQLVAPRSIEVNKPVDRDVFRVAGPGDSSITDLRKFRFDFEAPEKSVSAADVNDVVEFANTRLELQKEEAASKKK